MTLYSDFGRLDMKIDHFWHGEVMRGVGSASIINVEAPSLFSDPN